MTLRPFGTPPHRALWPRRLLALTVRQLRGWRVPVDVRDQAVGGVFRHRPDAEARLAVLPVRPRAS